MSSLRQRLAAALGGLPSTFWTLWTGMLINRTATFVVTFLALYLTRERGLSPDAAGRIISLYGVGVLLAGPIGGLLADRAGRRVTMLQSLVLGGACVAALAFVTSVPALAALTFIGALVSEQYRPAAQAVIADVVPLAEQPRAFGLIYWAVNLGFTLGIAAAGFVAERSIAALFVVDAAASFLFAALVFLRLPETRPPSAHAGGAKGSALTALCDKHLMRLLGLHLVTLVVFAQFQLALPLDLEAHGFGPKAFAWLMVVNGVGVLVLQPVIAPWLRSVDAGKSLAFATLLIGAGFGVNAFADSLPLYILGVALWTVGEIFSFPVAVAVVAALSSPEQRGRYQGVMTMAMGVAWALSPVLGGEVMARYGARPLWLACFVAGALVAVGHLGAAGSRRRHIATLAAARPSGSGHAGADGAAP